MFHGNSNIPIKLPKSTTSATKARGRCQMCLDRSHHSRTAMMSHAIRKPERLTPTTQGKRRSRNRSSGRFKMASVRPIVERLETTTRNLPKEFRRLNADLSIEALVKTWSQDLEGRPVPRRRVTRWDNFLLQRLRGRDCLTIWSRRWLLRFGKELEQRRLRRPWDRRPPMRIRLCAFAGQQWSPIEQDKLRLFCGTKRFIVKVAYSERSSECRSEQNCGTPPRREESRKNS